MHFEIYLPNIPAERVTFIHLFFFCLVLLFCHYNNISLLCLRGENLPQRRAAVYGLDVEELCTALYLEVLWGGFQCDSWVACGDKGGE